MIIILLIKMLQPRIWLIVGFQVDVFQVEERGFYVRLVSIKGEGVAASLYRALESLTGFIVQSSNLATTSEGFVLTFTLNVSSYLPCQASFLSWLLHSWMER